MGGPVIQWVEQKSSCQATHPLHLASKFFFSDGVEEMVTNGLQMRIKNPLKKNFMLFFREMAERGDLIAYHFSINPNSNLPWLTPSF